MIVLPTFAGILMPQAAAGSSYDSDAEAFFTAAGITDNTQKSAINQLVLDLKSYSLWSKMSAIYPFVGGTGTTHKFNLKDPRDLDAAFRLVFNGGWTHSSTGATPNGTTGYADTKFDQSANGAINNEHISIYIRTNSAANVIQMGMAGASNVGTNLNPRSSADAFASRCQSATNDVLVANTDSRGFYLSSRTVSTEYRKQKNATSTTVTNTSTAVNARSFYIGARNNNGTADAFAAREIAFATIGQGLTSTEAGNLYTAIQTYQGALSRSV